MSEINSNNTSPSEAAANSAAGKSRKKERMEVKRSKMLFLDAFLAVLLLAIDQYTKHLAVVNLKDKPSYVLFDGILELQYLENRGSAFGMLQNQKFFILFVGIVFLAVIFFFLFKLPQQKKFCSVHLLLSAVIAGGIGNMLDRIRFDFVIDFIYFVLIDYPIFNIADCYIVCSTITLFILFLFVFKEKDLEFLNFKQNRYREVK